MFENRSGFIFRKRWLGLFSAKYPNHKFKQILTEKFGNKKVGDLKNLVCIQAYDIFTHKNMVFKKSDKDITDIALSTSAAPTYFPIYTFVYHIIY
jgi:uncharacterized protein